MFGAMLAGLAAITLAARWASRTSSRDASWRHLNGAVAGLGVVLVAPIAAFSGLLVVAPLLSLARVQTTPDSLPPAAWVGPAAFSAMSAALIGLSCRRRTWTGPLGGVGVLLFAGIAAAASGLSPIDPAAGSVAPVLAACGAGALAGGGLLAWPEETPETKS